MNKEEIMNKIQLYEFCENMEELYDDYYVPLQQENKQLKLELLEKKCSDKDIEYKEKLKLQQRIDKAIKYLEQPNRDNFDFSKAILLEILKGE